MEDITRILTSAIYYDKYVQLMEGDSFIRLINKIGRDICIHNKSPNEIKNTVTLNCECAYPISYIKRIIKVCIDEIKYKNSVFRPIIIQ